VNSLETNELHQARSRNRQRRTDQQLAIHDAETVENQSAEIIATEGEIITHPNERMVEADLHEPPVIVHDTISNPKYIVKGKVTYLDDGSPLPGVNVIIKGTSIGTVTDLDGNYELALNNPDDALVFAYIGYESREVPVASKNEINVSLDEDVTQLSEVVVTGHASRRRAEQSTPPIMYLAEPTIGREAYQKYLEEQLQYPRQALENKIEGRVLIQFTVESNGQLSNFKILKGLGHGCDDEVIRLIKQGPAWTPSRKEGQPVSDKVKVRLKFDLPTD